MTNTRVYAGISVDEWGAANARVMNRLLITGDLRQDEIDGPQTTINSEGSLVYEAWAKELPQHDPKRQYILNGVSEGFHIVKAYDIEQSVFMDNY